MRMSIMENLKSEKLFELELPDGTKMRAVTSENITYPAINIEIFHNGSWEKVCCAEYDSDRAEGKKLCVGAFTHDCDFPMYYDSYFLGPVD